jgi:hypothetical protein
MKVKCKTNKVSDLPEALRMHAFTQDQYGIADITPGKTYEVFGIWNHENGTSYLVLTDSVRADLPWWMASQFYEQPEGATPSQWATKRYGKTNVVTAPLAYHKAIERNEDDIIDKTPAGYEAFEEIKRAMQG